jgi:hypothetical protein
MATSHSPVEIARFLFWSDGAIARRQSVGRLDLGVRRPNFFVAPHEERICKIWRFVEVLTNKQ